CVREGRQRLFDSIPWGAHREFSYVERGFYGEQLERALELFPREQLLVLQSDDLRKTPTKALATVASFLGGQPPADVSAREVHVGADVGSSLTDEDRDYLAELYSEDQQRLHQ